MDAGRGASEQAVKAAAAVEQARRQLAAAERRQRAWEAGAEGERRTAEVLTRLAAAGWVVLHDLHWPGRPLANLDHVAVGPGGVVVIDSKNWSGTVDVRDGTLRQNGYRRSQACDAAATAAAAVAALLEPQHRRLVGSVVCLVGQPTPADQPPQVHVVGLTDLHTYLRSLTSQLAPADVERIAHYLRRTLSGTRSPAQTTTAAVPTAGGVPEPSARARARRHASPPSGAPRASAPRPTGSVGRTRGGASRRRTTFDASSGAIVKLALLLLLALVVLPRFLQGLGEVQPTTPGQAPSVTSTTGPPPGPTAGR